MIRRLAPVLVGCAIIVLVGALVVRGHRTASLAVRVVSPDGRVVGFLDPSAGPRGTTVRGRDGVLLTVPHGWRVDESAPPAGTLLRGPGATVWVFVQDLNGLPASADEYIAYGNRSVLQQWSGIRLLLDQTARVNGIPVRVLAWTRPRLKYVPGEDMNDYKEYDLIYSPKLVVTLMLKATPEAFGEAQVVLHTLAASVHLLPKGAASDATVAWSDGEKGRAWEEWETRDRLQWPLPARGLVWGIYDPLLEPDAWQLNKLKQFEHTLGTKFGLLMTYQHFSDPFPAKQMEEAARDGRLVMLTLQSWRPIQQDKVFTTATTLIFELLEGKYDEYLHRYARAAAAWGRPFFFRLDNEMNADWSPWGAFHYGKDADLYVYAWRHIWHIFQEEGATNAIWVWNPNDTSFPNWKWNHQSRYWPGGRYVDWVGLTAYNLGNAYPGTVWREFRDAYRPVYEEYRRMYPGKPLMITEFASHDGGGDKARWIRDMFAALKEDFPEIRFAVWWNGTDGARRYRLDSTAAAREAFARGIRDPYFVDPVRFAARK